MLRCEAIRSPVSVVETRDHESRSVAAGLCVGLMKLPIMGYRCLQCETLHGSVSCWDSADNKSRCSALRGAEDPLCRVEDSGAGELCGVAVSGFASGPGCHQSSDARCKHLRDPASSCVKVLLQRQEGVHSAHY